MKIALFGYDAHTIEPELTKHGFSVVSKNPKFVVSYGGDGTLMRAEMAHQGIPKIVLRNSSICKKCSPLSNEDVLEHVKSGNYSMESLMKLSASASGEELIGLNDIIVHNKDPRHGIRYRLSVDGKDIGHEVIGDGIVVATPFGSTAYFRSITDSFFDVGIGIAFNNSTEQFDHMIISENGLIEMTITRGPATVYADNQEISIQLEEGDTVVIKKSALIAKLIVPH